MNFLWTLVTGVRETLTAAVRVLRLTLARPAAYPAETHAKSLSVEVVRPEDLLVLTLDFYNLEVAPTAGASPARLEKIGPGTGFIVAHFPPQNVAEQAFFEVQPGSPSDPSVPKDPDPLRPPPIGGAHRRAHSACLSDRERIAASRILDF